MPIAVPIGNESCNDCNLCCTLNYAVKSPGGGKFWWDCQCPGGVLTMESGPYPGLSFSTIADWSPSGTNYWYPFDPALPPNSTGETRNYRLKCTLPSGEVYYSNVVTAAIGNASTSGCKCADAPDDVKSISVQIDWSVQPYTQSTHTFLGGTRVYGTETHYTTVLACPSNSWTTLFTVDKSDPLNTKIYFVEALFEHQGIAGGQIRCQVRARLTTNTGTTTIVGMGATAYRDLNDLLQGWRGFSQCWDFELNNAPQELNLCTEPRPNYPGVPDSAYCAEGPMVRVNAITLLLT